jgi:hypothetical protein
MDQAGGLAEAALGRARREGRDRAKAKAKGAGEEGAGEEGAGEEGAGEEGAGEEGAGEEGAGRHVHHVVTVVGRRPIKAWLSAFFQVQLVLVRVRLSAFLQVQLVLVRVWLSAFLQVQLVLVRVRLSAFFQDCCNCAKEYAFARHCGGQSEAHPAARAALDQGGLPPAACRAAVLVRGALHCNTLTTPRAAAG